jgi:hypothetical protein
MMRGFMRTLFCFPLVLGLLLSLSACVFDKEHQTSSALGEAPPATPRIIEFATDLGMSWNPGFLNGMWRTVVDDTRASGKVHIVSEAQCPNRYRVIVTGAERSDTIYIDKTMYQRIADGPWTVRTMPMRHMILNSCGRSGPPIEDPARIRLLAEEFRDGEVSGPYLREIDGRKCREWTRKIPNFRGPLLLTTCFDVKTHAAVQTKYGDQVTTFDWDVKVDIKRPM